MNIDIPINVHHEDQICVYFLYTSSSEKIYAFKLQFQTITQLSFYAHIRVFFWSSLDLICSREDQIALEDLF